MSFTTVTFFVFVALVFPTYWALRHHPRWQNGLLVVASYVFYGWWDPRFCLLMLASSLVDYGVGRGLGRAEHPGRRRALLGLSLASNLGLLGYFKYAGFFVENLVVAAAGIGVDLEVSTLRIILPVGISFYTFQTLSYTIDIYRGTLQPTKSLVDYLAFVSFFPQLVAGPIERAAAMIPQFTAKRQFDAAMARDGGRQILWGLWKKMFIADNLAPFVNAVYATPEAYTGWQHWLATLAFAFQIYADFSAYSDIAIGLGKLFGFRLMQNFDYPYFSRSLSEFWRRWHISLSSWFRDYVYIPLGGNRVSEGRRAFNVVVTFTVSGLWHGASWNFVIWGLIHGIGVLPSAMKVHRRFLPAAPELGQRLWAYARGLSQQLVPASPSTGVTQASVVRQRLRRFANPWPFFQMAGTFLLVLLGWVFFRAETLADAIYVLQQMMLAPFTDGLGSALVLIGQHNFASVALPGVLVMLAIEWAARNREHPLMLMPRLLPRSVRWGTYVGLLFMSLLFMGRSDAFIYFQF